MTFYLTCVHIIIFSSVSVALWPPFGKYLLTRMTICSLCILTICNTSYFQLWYWGLELGSDRPSSWSLLTFYFYQCNSPLLKCQVLVYRTIGPLVTDRLFLCDPF